MMIFSKDIGFLITIPTAAIVALILLIVLTRSLPQQSLATLLMIALFCAASWLLFRASDGVRTTARWLVHSKAYKTEVLALPNPINGQFKHVEWDGWGFAGSDTVGYLVFDPKDSLAAAAKSRSYGRFNGIPCEIFKVRRLESDWYAVYFYTDTDWDHCT
ncbi:MAG: hypothetical protein SA176_13650 [Edaphobacter sp.]|nr:hypothetical protein [Edaphobacter sp.]